MSTDLEDRIRRLGLQPEWVDILKGLGINTLREFRDNCYNQEVSDELKQQASVEEVDTLANLLQQCGSESTDDLEHQMRNDNVVALSNIVQKDESKVTDETEQQEGNGKVGALSNIVKNNDIGLTDELRQLSLSGRFDDLERQDRDDKVVVISNIVQGDNNELSGEFEQQGRDDKESALKHIVHEDGNELTHELKNTVKNEVESSSSIAVHNQSRVTDELEQRVRGNEVKCISNLSKQDGRNPSGDIDNPEPMEESSTEDITSPVPCVENPLQDNCCLKLFLKNSTLDHSIFCNIFTSEGICSLKELQKVVRNKEKLSKIFSKINSADKVNLQEILETNLDDVVEHESILSKLGLIQYFPEKISLETVLVNYADKLITLKDVPWYFLSKMLMLDYRGRDDLLPESINTDMNDDDSGMRGGEEHPDNFLEDMFSKFEDISFQTTCSSAPHPMDVLIVIFQCSSNALRQVLCEKMFMCKLSIPLILPQFLNDRSIFLLWSLRNIVIEYLLPNGDFYEDSIVSCPISIVLCLRLGEVSRSKSKILNEVINSQSHDTFFHRDCKNGMMNRTISTGLAEIAWHLPSSKKRVKDQLDEIMAFINLRGDGKLHNTNNKFLCEISNVVLVMVDVSELKKPDVMSSLKSITAADTELILMLSKAPSTNFNAKNKEVIRNCVRELECENFRQENIIFDFTPTGEKNIKLVKEEVVTRINLSQERKPHRKSLENCRSLEESVNIVIDENTPKCDKGKRMTIKIMQDLIKGKIENAKKNKLPLQCKPWQEWAKLNKEEHRLQRKTGDSVANYVASLYTQKKQNRREQLYYIKKPSILFQTFLDNFLKIADDDKFYYLKWLKLYLDNISRKTIPGLQKNYSSKWNEICQYESRHIPSNLQTELKTLETKLAEASFGLEHLMREIGQSYEAVTDLRKEVTQTIQDRIARLPQIMAEILLHGYPLELMDGDASHVPLLWVKAVLEELGNLIGNDKKIFVLSVLGIQSSGKSTLLNAMFGLQFAVAAGRCTRGVYAQLVPLCKDLPNIIYDYILVVDTEGLRAAELGTAKLQHDNEIATLVIGLGDVTLVNIKGENVSEMEDVLQIVVHAILKMKLVNKSLKLQPSCIFIHQNVGAPDAAQKLKSGQQRFVETLDKVTKAAGDQADAPDYCKFKQVIDFDINKNVWYFSDLWKGDPPMAPANPGYSEKVNAVKQTLLTDIMPKRASHLTIPKLRLKIEDLWKGILDQNFVFSFKNSLEMNAYSSLESALSDLCWSLKNHALKWLNNKRNVIASQETQIEKLEDQLIRECNSYIGEEYNATLNKLRIFFEVNDDKEMLEQWRDNTFLKLKGCYEEILIRTKKDLRNEIMIRKIQITQRRDTQKYKDEILNNARKLADELRGQNLSEESVTDHFHLMWDQWMKNLTLDHEQDEVNIYEAVMNVLLCEFQHNQPLFLQVQDQMNVRKIKKNFSVAIGNHLTEQSFFQKFFKNVKETADTYVKELFEKIELNIRSLKGQDLRDDHAKDLVNLVITTVTKMTNTGIKFKGEERLKIDLAVYACQLVSYKFSREYKMETVNSKDSNDVKCRIEEIDIHPTFKRILYHSFPRYPTEVLESIEKCCIQQGSIGNFEIDIDTHVTIDKTHLGKKQISQGDCKKNAYQRVEELFKEIESYVEKREIQAFKEEYAEAIIKKVHDMVKGTDMAKTGFKFKMQFKIELAVHVCRFAIPKFFEKHRRYMDNTDPKIVFERNYKETYFEMFKNFYKMSANEKALAGILSQHLSKAIESTIDKDMARKLADDVRGNVGEVTRKSTLLPAILNGLLDINSFEEFHLYLNDTNGCFDKWIAYFINKYLFGKSKYVEIASQEVKSLVSKVCRKIKYATEITLKETKKKDDINYWIRVFHRRVMGELPIPENDLPSLANGYNIVDLSSFTEHMKTNLMNIQKKLCYTFAKHNEAHLKFAHADSVYKLISQECKGCTEHCPFCRAPCSHSTDNHTENVKHKALEHYPQACGKYVFVDSKKLVTDNCSLLVAGDASFKSVETNDEWHPYKNYRKIYPDWEIDGDPTVDASPYWKWFLVQYEYDLAKLYNAQLPDIPSAWGSFNIDMARESVKKNS